MKSHKINFRISGEKIKGCNPDISYIRFSFETCLGHQESISL